MRINDVIDNILATTAGTSIPHTVDTFKAGDPAQPVKHVVCTFLANMDVLKKAVDLGANLVITHEPTYYNHRDEISTLAGDPVVEVKRAFIAKHGLVIWRYHDFCHRHKPDLINDGFARHMNWLEYRDPASDARYHIPPTTLNALAVLLKQKLHLTDVRVAGDPQMRCRTISLSLGSPGESALEGLRRPDTDVTLAGEAQEWVMCEYVRDARALGKQKALIVLGHFGSEGVGMEYFAAWLRKRLPDLEISYVPTGEPYWTA